MSHKLEVGERRSLASHYTLTTGDVKLLHGRSLKLLQLLQNLLDRGCL